VCDTVAHTVARRIMDDIEQGQVSDLHKTKVGGDGLITLAESRNVRCVTYDDWKRLDTYETNLGQERGKPREKIIDIDRMLEITSNSTS
jgi:hypothetical protein